MADTVRLVASNDHLFETEAWQADAGFLVALLLGGVDEVGHLAWLVFVAPNKQNATHDLPIRIHSQPRGVS